MSNAAKIASKEDVLRFALGGRSTFSLRSATTGAHHTFEVIRAKESRKQGQEPPWFVQMRVGAEYIFIGTVFADSKAFFPKHGLILEDDTGLKAFCWFWTKLFDTRVPSFEKLEVWHEGVCSACGRPLTKPESIAIGLGPICREKSPF